MTPASNRYWNWTVKSLLVVVYLLFFTAHLNGRYFSVANFFVYGKAAIKTQQGTHIDNAQHKSSHLNLDKRFHGQEIIKAVVCDAWSLVIPVEMAAATDYAFFPEEALQSLSYSRCQRGPPAPAHAGLPIVAV